MYNNELKDIEICINNWLNIFYITNKTFKENGVIERIFFFYIFRVLKNSQKEMIKFSNRALKSFDKLSNCMSFRPLYLFEIDEIQDIESSNRV